MAMSTAFIAVEVRKIAGRFIAHANNAAAQNHRNAARSYHDDATRLLIIANALEAQQQSVDA